MIGLLPTTLTINNRELAIDTNFKTILLCMEILNDPDLKNNEKNYLVIDFIIGVDKLDPKDYEEAMKQITWFIDGGKDYKNNRNEKKIMDWEQDEQLIFSAINKVANKETRECKYIHWWTWLGYFTEVGEGLFSTVVNIRQKKSRGKKLSKEEQEFYTRNKDLIDIRNKYTQEEKEEIERLNKALG